MRKYLVVIGCLFFSISACMPNAFAFTKAESSFLKGIKSYKIPSLKKNTDAELIAIGRTSCGDVYYATTIAGIYKKNHYIENASSARAMVTEAKKYLCVKEVILVLDNGDVVTAKVYDANTPVIDAGTIYSSESQTESKIQNGQKPAARPTNNLSVDVLNTKTVNNFRIELGDQYLCNFKSSDSKAITTYSWFYSFPVDSSGAPANEIQGQSSNKLIVTQEILNYFLQSQETLKTVICKVTSKSSSGEVMKMAWPTIGAFKLTAP